MADYIGARVSPLRQGEQDALAWLLDKAQPDQVAGIFISLNRGLGRDGAAAVADAIALAVRIAEENPARAALIIRGRRLLADNPDVRPSAAEREAAVQVVYGDDLFKATSNALAPHIAAAEGVYAAARVPGGDFSFDPPTFEDALNAVAGGIVEFNGQKILWPSSEIDAASIPDVLAAFAPGDLIRFGNGRPVHGDGSPFFAGQFEDSDTQLFTVAPGRYHVRLNGLGFVLTENGTLYELDLARATREVLSRLMQPGAFPRTPQGGLAEGFKLQ